MSTFNNIFRFSNVITGSYKNVLLGRINCNTPQMRCYTKKSVEAKLGIDKPKRPLTPFFKFMGQMRPALLAKNPGISSKEAIAGISKHWHQLDSETKAQMTKEYEKDVEDYKKIKAIYESSLTDQQKEDIQKLKDDIAAAKEKRKLKAEYKELGRPRKPMTSYILFAQTKKDLFKGRDLKEFQSVLKAEWVKLSDSNRVKYEKQALELMNKYRKDLQVWEMKMISMGRMDLVKEKKLRLSKAKAPMPSQ